MTAAGAFTELSPGLRQIFFIGDGLTGEETGDVQTFRIPDDATRLLLGYSDCCSPSTPNLPGYYSDNTGTGTATINVPTCIDKRAPSAFRLEEVFPNPFNSSTTLRFSLEYPRVFDIGIYNVHGQLLRTLLLERVEGTRTISWDGRDASGDLIPSGISCCRLKSGRCRPRVRYFC